MNGAPEVPAPEVKVHPASPDLRIGVDVFERRVRVPVTSASFPDRREPRRKMPGHRFLDPGDFVGVEEQVLEVEVGVEHCLRPGSVAVD